MTNTNEFNEFDIKGLYAIYDKNDGYIKFEIYNNHKSAERAFKSALNNLPDDFRKDLILEFITNITDDSIGESVMIFADDDFVSCI